MVAPTIYDFIRGGLFWVAIIFLSKYARAWWNKPGTKSRAEQAEDDPNALLRIIERQQDGGVDYEKSGGKTEEYSWTQTSDELEVKILINNIADELVPKRDISVDIQCNFLKVLVQNKIIINDYTCDVLVPEECTWTVESNVEGGLGPGEKLERKVLFLYLRKKFPTKGKDNWNCLVKSEANKIDNTHLGAPVHLYNPNDRASMRNVVQSLRRRR